MPFLRRLKQRVAEKLDETNPLIVWYLRHARAPWAGLSLFALASIIGLVIWIFQEQSYPLAEVPPKEIELFWWIYSGVFSLFIIICGSPDAVTTNDEFMARFRTLSPLEEFHGSLVQQLLPIFCFWALNVAVIFLLALFFVPAGKLFLTVTLPPLFLTAFAFSLAAFNTCSIKSFLAFTVSFLVGSPGILILLVDIYQLAVCFFTDRGYYSYTISLLLFLPFYCMIYYRLGRHQLTYNYYRPYHGALPLLLVSGGVVVINGAWIFVLNYWIMP